MKSEVIYNEMVVIDEETDLWDVYTFKKCSDQGVIWDDCGYGYAVKDGMRCTSLKIHPSETDKIPSDATHIDWYNK